MPWPLPQPGDISNRAAAIYEAEFARIWMLRNPGAPAPVVDARSPLSSLAVHGRTLEMSSWDLYLYQARLALELMPDTAIDWLSRHGNVWGVPQDQPVASIGVVDVTGTINEDVPAGVTFSAPGGAVYVTTAAVQLSASGLGALPVAAQLPGSAGDLPAGTLLTLVSGVSGISPPTGAVDENGVTGGQDLEDVDSWRARILARIRAPRGGGTASDYAQWVGEVLPYGVINPIEAPGIVTVVLAVMVPGQAPRVPTPAELATVTAYLQDATKRKPLGMTIVVMPATLVPTPVSLVMTPDTQAIEAAATAALVAYFNAAATIGGALNMSQLDAALSNASGETSHVRLLPAGDANIVFTPTQLPVLQLPVIFTPPASA